MNFTLEPGPQLSETSFNLKVHRSLTVDEVTDLDARNNHGVGPVIVLSLMARLCEPKEGQDNHDETISDVITLLNHAVNKLLDNEDDKHEKGENDVDHSLGVQVLGSSDNS